MNISEILRDEHVWVAVGFFMFMGIAAKYVYPALVKTLDDRSAKIKAEIEEAAKLKAEAEKLLKEAQKKLKDADQAAAEIVERARFETKQIADDAEKEIEAEMERKMRLAEEKIARAEAGAIEQVKSKAVEAAVAAAEKIITNSLSGAEGKNFAKKSAELITQKVA